MPQTLFPTDLPEGEWVEFQASGFGSPVVGVIHRRSYRALCGVPLGSIDTGCLDLDSGGLFGLCSIFNSHVPRRGALNLPFLGLGVGGKTWVLTTGQQSPEKGSGHAANDPPPPDLEMPGVQLAQDIHYWGHFPVADLEFETDAPVDVGLRAWAPFLPGDVDRSILPGAVFEVHLRNESDAPQSGTLAFSFFGPSVGESWANLFPRQQISTPVQGVSVSSRRCSYVLGAVGEERVRTGGELGLDAGAWARIEQELPKTEETRSGASVAVDFSLAPHESKVVRFVLTWYSPHWMSTGDPLVGPRAFRHMHTTRYASAPDAAAVLAEEHGTLLARVLAWQEVIFAEQALPAWLREALVNTLHTYAETSFWAVAEPPIGEWCRPEDGLFAINESPRSCPQMECLPTAYFGGIPMVYFFPRLVLSALRGQKAYQSENGAPPLIFGGITQWTGGCEMASPTPGYQVTTNVPCFVDLVDRYGLLHGDDAFVQEFYPSIKKSIEFMADLNRGPDGIASMPDRLVSVHIHIFFETEWYEFSHWAGIVPHVGGLHLVALRMAERMAQAAGDEPFAEQCRAWIEAGSNSIENKTWAGDYYLRYLDPETGDKSDDIFSVQLDGEWMAGWHGVEGIFRPDRVATTLETIKRTCVAATPLGTVHYTTPEGVPAAGGEELDSVDDIWYSWPATQICLHAPVTLGLTYMYAGQPEFGLEVMRRFIHKVHCERGLSWYGANIIDSPGGEVAFGTEYTIGTQLWAVPAAMQQRDIRAPAQPGGLVDRVLRAAAGESQR